MGNYLEFEHLTPQQLIRLAVSDFGRSVAIGTSFQAEGMVILDMAVRIAPDIPVFTIDTGRLPEETHQMIDTVRSRYGVDVEVVRPEPAEVDAMVELHGRDLFYQEVALRRLCCEVRKVRPLERKLSELGAWISGLRRSDAQTRAEIPKVDWSRSVWKISPLADWTREQVREYVEANGVPEHPLYKRGYTSIGCDPCSRAVAPGEDPRAGRWWWEQDAAKECGIHFTPNGRAEKTLDVLLNQIVAHA
jgi:phosphoadenosine phosphosulfate reductase